jgi:hypothetical protein
MADKGAKPHWRCSSAMTDLRSMRANGRSAARRQLFAERGDPSPEWLG